MKIKTCPIMEAIAKKLFGIEAIINKSIKRRMINAAVEAGKDAAERVYGGFDMMRLHRENEQLKRENSMLCHELNKIYENCMSIENAQQMMLDFANSRVAHTNYCSDIDHRNDVFKFFEEWRQDNI